MTPREAVADVAARPRIPDGGDERFTGYGVLGQPFANGHHLALRVMTATTIGPAYRAVWHRNAHENWHMFTTAPPEVSCPRYFSSAASFERVPAIAIDWTGDARLRVTIPQVLTWTLDLRATPATRMMSTLGASLPAGARTSRPLLSAMGPMARPVLRAGRMRLTGGAPNHQRYRVVPTRVWRIIDGTASVGRVDLEPAPRTPEQPRLGDFWMPRQGIFYIGDAWFDTFDPLRHIAVV